MAPSAEMAQNGTGKTHFANLYVTKTTHRFTHFPAHDLNEI